MDKNSGRIKVFLLSLALVMGAMFAAPAEPLQASECGGGDGRLCSETQACAGWFWGRVCTTTYKYYVTCAYCHLDRVEV